MSQKFDLRDVVLASRFKIGQRIGGGSFGEIFRGVNLSTGDVIAVKVESANCKFPQLVFELKLYQSVNPRNDALGIPSVYWYGREGDYNCLVMDLLGPSIEDLHSYCGRKFSFKTTMILGAQMLNRLEHLHNQGFIHRDIKPDNFLMGAGPSSHIVYIIDFGLAKRYREHKTLNHIPHKDGKSLTGTARYCSINTHCGIEQSRRDDLDAIAYMLVYFLKGRLPWQDLPPHINKQQRYDRIMEKKMAVSPEQLCAGIAPPEILSFVKYCRSLGFSDTPDYFGWRKVFVEALKAEGLRFDYQYDWLRDMSSHVIPNPLMGMAKHRRRQMNSLAAGTILTVAPMLPLIEIPRRPEDGGDVSGSNVNTVSTYQSNTNVNTDVNVTLGNDDGNSRGLLNDEGNDDILGALGGLHSPRAHNYIPVIPPGQTVAFASNIVHCRFIPYEPFLIPRQAPNSQAYEGTSSEGSNDGR